MIALARILNKGNRAVLQVTPQPKTDEERAAIAKLAEYLPLSFTLPYVNVAHIGQDAADFTAKQMEVMWPQT